MTNLAKDLNWGSIYKISCVSIDIHKKTLKGPLNNLLTTFVLPPFTVRKIEDIEKEMEDSMKNKEKAEAN